MGKVHLIASQDRRPVRACSTCRHFRPDHDIVRWSDCLATSKYADVAREEECLNGALWEPIPEPVPVLIRFKRWLIG